MFRSTADAYKAVNRLDDAKVAPDHVSLIAGDARLESFTAARAVLVTLENGTTIGTSSSANPIATALQKCIAASIKTAAFDRSATPPRQ